MGALTAWLSMHQMCTVPLDANKGCQTTWYWSYRWLLATVCVLGIESTTSGKASGALNH